MEQKFKIGDRVKIVNYGHRIISYKPLIGAKLLGPNEYDIRPEMVGKVGAIYEVGKSGYGIDLDGRGKHAWYDKVQLEKIDTVEQEIKLQPLKEPYYCERLPNGDFDEPLFESKVPHFADFTFVDLMRVLPVAEKILTYCQDAGCSPEDLIEAHKNQR